MKNILNYIPGFRSNTKSKIIVALLYYGYCVYKIPSQNLITSIIGFALPFIFFALVASGNKRKEGTIKSGKLVEVVEPIKPNKPIVLTKSLKIKIIASIVVLLGFGMYSNSVQKKKDIAYAVEQKVIADKQVKIDAEAKKVADAKAVEDKKIADAKAVQDAKDAKAQVIKDKKAADAKAKAQAEADKVGYDTGTTYSQLARNPDKYIGEKVKFSGEVIQVMEGDGEVQLRIAVNGNYDNILLAAYDSSIITSRVLENDQITIKGISTGVITYKSTMGGDITIPGVVVNIIN